MRIVRYLDPAGVTHYGTQHPGGEVCEIAGDVFGTFNPTAQPALVRKFLAPIVPSAIFCIGLNYRKHAEESGSPLPSHPVLFMKSPAALQHPGDPIAIPTHLASREVDYEAELVVVIGRRCRNATRANALDHVLGYTCGNDVSARDWQKQFGGGQFCRGKTFDTFAPMGPALVTPEAIPDPNRLAIRTHLNGKVVQDASTNDMIFDVPSLIEFLSGSTTLLPGTAIFTGTPSGVGMAAKPPRWLQPGDRVSVEIETIGTLANPVISEPSDQ